MENYQIPLILGYYNEHWVYGKEAKRLAEVQEENTISDLYVRAVRREKVEFAGKTRDAVWLLAKYIELTLEGFPEIEYITFSVADTNIDMSADSGVYASQAECGGKQRTGNVRNGG